MNLRKCIAGLGVMAATLSGASALGFVSVTDNVRTDTTWTNDNVYILTKIIFVSNNATLTIEPGTIIRGVSAPIVLGGGSPLEPGQSDISDIPGALVVSRGSKVLANGTCDCPIIFTSIDDPNVPGGAATIPASFVNSLGNTKTLGTDYGVIDTDGILPNETISYAVDGPESNNAFSHSGRWGGVIVLGLAYTANGTDGVAAQGGNPLLPALTGDPLNPADPGAGAADEFEIGLATSSGDNRGLDYIEGIDPTNSGIPGAGKVPNADGDNLLSAYGGATDDDDSGCMRFVQIRYSGFELPPDPEDPVNGNEINSLTMGGMGSSTVLEFVESSFNQDDGFEFFGGNTDSKFLFGSFIGDDNFDADEGHRGLNQFLCAIQGSIIDDTRTGAYGTDFVGWTGSNSFDYGIEFDGVEPVGLGALPRGDMGFYNVTLLLDGNDECIQADDEANCQVVNTVVDQIRSTAEELFEQSGDGNILDYDNVHYTSTKATLVKGATTVNVGSDQPGAPEAIHVRGTTRYTPGGVDPRLAPGNAARTANPNAIPSTLAQVAHAGFQVENTFLQGWSYIDRLGQIASGSIAAPSIKLGAAGSNPTVNFTSDASVAVITYVIEKSTDGKNWSSVGTVTTASTSEAVSFTDTSTTLTAGTACYYRAFGL